VSDDGIFYTILIENDERTRDDFLKHLIH